MTDNQELEHDAHASFDAPYQSDDVEEACLFTAVRKSSQLLTTWFDSRLATSGLRATMFRLLSRVAADESLNISTLAERLGLDRSTLGRNLRVLERAGLVTLKPAADERARIVDLTDQGREALRVATPIWRDAQSELRAALGPRAGQLLAILSDLPLNERR